MKNKSKTILIFIDYSWGELHWILPVIVYLRNNFKQINTVVYFNTFNKEDILEDKDIMSEILLQNVSESYSMKDFLAAPAKFILSICSFDLPGSNKFVRGIKKIQRLLISKIKNKLSSKISQELYLRVLPDLIIRDTGGDFGVREGLLTIAQKKNIPVVISPHGSDLKMMCSVTGQSLSMIGDVLMCPSEMMKEYYNYLSSNVEKVVVGNPRYDQWWIKYVQEQFKMKNNESLPSNKRNILYITRGAHPQYLSKENFKYLITKTVETVLSDSETFLIIRPHPRQSIEQLKNMLKGYNRDRWRIDTTDVFCISNKIDVVISMWSSMILDCVAAKLPVIEFYRFEGSQLKWDVDEQGEPITYYCKDGFALMARTEKDLQSCFKKVMENREQVCSNQSKNFKRFVPESSELATQATVNILIDKLQLVDQVVN